MQEYILEGKIRRKAERVICDTCDIVFLKRSTYIKDKNYCSVKCRGKSQRNGVDVICWTCGKTKNIIPSKKAKSKSGLFFCNRKCQSIAQSFEGGCKEIQPSSYRGGRAIYRKRAFHHYKHVCASCGYNEHLEILEVHHRDGDRENNKIENLVILCPNCHVPITRKYATLTKDNELIWG